MELREIRLNNFRGYRQINIELSKGIQMFVGKNDIGKSTIFEALDLFFNDKDASVKLSVDDLNVFAKAAGDNIISITCSFALMERDSLYIETVKINPAEEFLLNAKGLIELTKEWDFSASASPKAVTYINCNIPDAIPVDIFTAKQADLKKKVKELNIEANANLSINSSMRKAIYAELIANGESAYSEKRIPTKNALAEKDIFDNLSKSFSDFYLFKADRKNSTSDDEIQNPMSIAVKKAFENDEIKNKITEIENIVKKELDQINAATIKKLQELDVDLAGQIGARISANWTNAIKNDIIDGNQVPINKRGSGIRRLLLLSYLMVEAEKKSFDRGTKDIIYAVEEPETALHPYMQKRFIKQLISLSQKNRFEFADEIPDNASSLNHYQVLITTHLPNFIGYANKEQVVALYRDENHEVCRYVGDDIIDFLQSEMGKIPVMDYKYVIFVEGENDVNALYNLGEIPELKAIFDIFAPEVSIIPLGGSNLVKCIELDYYWDLPIKQYHLYDSDVPKYKTEVIDKRCNSDENKLIKGRITCLKEMENYIPRVLLETTLGLDLSSYASHWQDADFSITNTLLAQPDTSNKQFTSIKNLPSSYKDKETALKGYLNKTVLRGVTKGMLEAHGVYSEIETWFKEMKELKDFVE